MVHQLGNKRFVVCVSSGLCLEFPDRWDAECCEESSGFKCFAQVATYAFVGQRLSILGYCATPELRHYLLNHNWQMSPEEKYTSLMEAAYTATDKDTYYKLIRRLIRS